MKKLTIGTWLILLFCTGVFGTASAYQSIQLSEAPAGMKVLNQDQNGITVKLDVGQIEFIPVHTKAGDFTMITADGLARTYDVGRPNLPQSKKLIAIPFGSDLTATVIDFEVEDISLADMNITQPVMPAQPSLSKSDDPEAMPFEWDQTVYRTNDFYRQELVRTEISGVLRDLNLGTVAISPMEYNPVENRLRVYKNITVQVTFNNSDWDKTREMRDKYYSPFFEPIYNLISNYSGFDEGIRGDSLNLVKYPVKYLIISHRMFEDQLQPFIEWKTKKGFIVQVAYTDVIGTTNTAIKSYIQSVYNAASPPEDPAPSFVLLVGDAQQIPPFSGSAGSHITDLRLCEFTNDNLPEIYYGRFSAQNTTQLQPQIDKTIEYERYEMPDPSYLEFVTLVSGVDASYASTYGNGQINYGTTYYFNTAHGIDPNVWLYPASNGGTAAADIRQTVSDGIGLYNYTAHCSHDGHATPSFETSHLAALTNYHKYLLGIGNCCQSNTFGTDYSDPCFGEAFLQIEGKGGIGYIGGSNSTYWDEDYFWGVGYGPIVGSGPTYEQTTQGAYDGVFHDHSEPVERHYVTNDAVVFAGNLAVCEGGSRVTYYWEIYHLMGDPSVSTYLGIPSENNISHEATVLLSAETFHVEADPGSYVGITFNGVLHGAAYIDDAGSADIPITPFGTVGEMDLVITAQNRVPYITTVQIISPDGPFVIHDAHSIDDGLGNGDGLVNCGESILLDVQLENVGP
nr:hypothetical protein [candidate division Zixibacteria bacterium]